MSDCAASDLLLLAFVSLDALPLLGQVVFFLCVLPPPSAATEEHTANDKNPDTKRRGDQCDSARGGREVYVDGRVDDDTA